MVLILQFKILSLPKSSDSGQIQVSYLIDRVTPEFFRTAIANMTFCLTKFSEMSKLCNMIGMLQHLLYD